MKFQTKLNTYMQLFVTRIIIFDYIIFTTNSTFKTIVHVLF